MRIHSDTRVSLSYDYGEVHDLSVGILQAFHDDGVSVGDGTLACGMTIARLLSTVKLTPDDEENFLTAMMEWLGAYFAEGGTN